LKNKNDMKQKNMVDLIELSGKTDLESQIEFIELCNETVLRCPVFISIINSLKELQCIKQKLVTEWATSLHEGTKQSNRKYVQQSTTCWPPSPPPDRIFKGW
jgi:hypothetical protein